MNLTKGVIVIVIIAVAVGAVYYLNLNKTNMANKDNQNEVKNSEMLKNSKNTDENIIAENVKYFEDHIGYFARPKGIGIYPGIVMIHEWWGLNDNIKEMARELAKEGYMVLAVDLFGKIAETQDEARKQTSSMDQTKALANMKAAMNFLKNEGAEKFGSLGWCFGGGQSLQLAISGEKLDATVIYYGKLVTDKIELQKIKWPVLGIFGEQDTSIPVSTVNDFKDALMFLSIPNSVNIYPNVGHAFANPSGLNYAPSETKDAWTKTVNFLNQNLKN